MNKHKMIIPIKKLHPDAKIPSRGSEYAAGFDMYALDNHELLPGEVAMIRTGIALEIPEGKVLLLWDRSGMGSKGIHRFAGVIDSDYRGEIKVVLCNHRNELFTISKGDRIIQGIIQDYTKADFIEVEELKESRRGAGAFGSSGK